jgi:ketosteroid isomerase-like protein
MSSVTTQDSRVARVLASLKSGDPADIQALCHPDLVIEDAESLPYGGLYKGFAGLADLAGKLFASVSDCVIETTSIIGDPAGDEFVLRQRMTGRAVRSGRPIDMAILEHYTFRDGLLLSIRPYYWDTKAFLDLLGD